MNNRLMGERWLTSRQKRAFDLSFALATVPALVPAAKIGAAAFSRESGLDPIFRQKRMGKAIAPIIVKKLRTMPYNGDYADRSSGDLDSRASQVGRRLRILKIDEVPMTRAVLQGHMAVVGPRPLVAADVDQTLELLSVSERRDWVRSRTIPKPGLVSMFNMRSRDMDPQADEYLLERAVADINYLEHASFELDLRVIVDACKGVAREARQSL